jgi:MutL protein
MTTPLDTAAVGKIRCAVDIGSTMIKIARVDECGELQSQDFFPRDFDLGIAAQVESLLADLRIDTGGGGIGVCSSANGGLRVGILCLTKRFSGVALRNQVLLAGANPVYVRDFDEPGGDPRRVDILLIGGGIDCADADPFARRLQRFDPGQYNYGALVYAANRHLAAAFHGRFPTATVIDNPLGETLSSRVGSVFEALRRAYLDDLVFKEGVSELRGNLARGIRPTPEVVSRGFLRAVSNKSSFAIVGACLALDVGGATTDLHYTVELVREDSEFKPASGVPVARFVFTDLGIVASRDTLMLQLRGHAQLYDFLTAVLRDNVRETYELLREGEYTPPAALLSYACLFLALDRFARGRGPGLPVADLAALSQIILTGGAVQSLDESVVLRLAGLLMPAGSTPPLIQIDRRYQIWVSGMTWTADLASPV